MKVTRLLRARVLIGCRRNVGTMGDGCCEEDKMEWVFTLIVLMIVPFWIVLWWIPHCDAIGIQKAK